MYWNYFPSPFCTTFIFPFYKPALIVTAAFRHVRDNIEEIDVDAHDTDLIFLKGLLDSPVVKSLVKVSEKQTIRLTKTITRNCYATM